MRRGYTWGQGSEELGSPVLRWDCPRLRCGRYHGGTAQRTAPCSAASRPARTAAPRAAPQPAPQLPAPGRSPAAAAGRRGERGALGIAGRWSLPLASASSCRHWGLREGSRRQPFGTWPCQTRLVPSAPSSIQAWAPSSDFACTGLRKVGLISLPSYLPWRSVQKHNSLKYPPLHPAWLALSNKDRHTCAHHRLDHRHLLSSNMTSPTLKPPSAAVTARQKSPSYPRLTYILPTLLYDQPPHHYKCLSSWNAPVCWQHPALRWLLTAAENKW